MADCEVPQSVSWRHLAAVDDRYREGSECPLLYDLFAFAAQESGTREASDETGRVREHLKRCPACRRIVDSAVGVCEDDADEGAPEESAVAATIPFPWVDSEHGDRTTACEPAELDGGGGVEVSGEQPVAPVPSGESAGDASDSEQSDANCGESSRRTERREFLRTAAEIAGAVFWGGNRGGSSGQHAHPQDQLEAMFDGLDRFAIDCGRQHAQYPGAVHPDILTAARVWAPVLQSRPTVGGWLPSDPDLDFNQNILALGSPAANEISRLALQMQGPWHELEPMDGRRRLYFEYVHASSIVKEEKYGVVMRYGRGKLLRTPNWIICDAAGREYIPEVSDRQDRFLVSDYLLISCLPNPYVPRERRSSSNSIVVIGGAHGASLAGVADFLHPRLLTQVIHELQGCTYFQVLLKMEGIEHDHREHKTKPGTFTVIQAIPLPDDVFEDPAS